MYTISKNFTFEAAHRLHMMEKTHPCRNLHGHSYTVKVTLQYATLQDTGMIADFRSLDVIKTYLNTNFDHTTLVAKNDNELVEALKALGMNYMILPIAQTTCELISSYLFNMFMHILSTNSNIEACKLLSVSVSETSKTQATYTGD